MAYGLKVCSCHPLNILKVQADKTEMDPVRRSHALWPNILPRQKQHTLKQCHDGKACNTNQFNNRNIYEKSIYALI